MNKGKGLSRRRQAATLAYGEVADAAPPVVAHGYGNLPDRIVLEAAAHGVYVHGSPELVGLLMQVDFDQQIPPRLYRVVAELLVWISDTLPLEDDTTA